MNAKLSIFYTAFVLILLVLCIGTFRLIIIFQAPQEVYDGHFTTEANKGTGVKIAVPILRPLHFQFSFPTSIINSSYTIFFFQEQPSSEIVHCFDIKTGTFNSTETPVHLILVKQYIENDSQSLYLSGNFRFLKNEVDLTKGGTKVHNFNVPFAADHLNLWLCVIAGQDPIYDYHVVISTTFFYSPFIDLIIWIGVCGAGFLFGFIINRIYPSKRKTIPEDSTKIPYYVLLILILICIGIIQGIYELTLLICPGTLFVGFMLVLYIGTALSYFYDIQWSFEWVYELLYYISLVSLIEWIAGNDLNTKFLIVPVLMLFCMMNYLKENAEKLEIV